MKKISEAWVATIAIAAIALVVTACGGPSDAGAPGNGLAVGPQAGKLAPDFTLPRPDGANVTLSSLRGKPVLVNFWATWCGPCRAEMPEFQRTHERLADKLVILAVNQKESKSQVEGYYKELGLTFPALLDRSGKVFDDYRAFGLPSTFLIDAQGVIQAVKFGPFASADDLIASLKKVGL